MVSNVDLITKYLNDKIVKKEQSKWEYQDKLIIFSKDYFSPKIFDTGQINLSQNTYSIHHFSQSWFGFKKKSIQYLKKVCFFVIGYKNTRNLIKYLKNE